VTYVLFWDIDGTLLTTARAGVYALEQAAADLGGSSFDHAVLSAAGLTDVKVAEIVLAAAGLEATHERTLELLRLYEGYLPDRLSLREGSVLPGVKEVLAHLTTRRDVVQLLLTGNTRAGATAKLRHYGLERFFDDGAFADDHPERPGIARRALEVARSRVPGLELERCYVIGDTPFDIACGDAIGARTVAVAGITHTADELRAHNPWCIFDGLPAPHDFERRLEIT
jgi:phosphoglycolate phosphatase